MCRVAELPECFEVLAEHTRSAAEQLGPSFATVVIQACGTSSYIFAHECKLLD